MVGIGSDNGDDQAGWLVARALLARGWSPAAARIAAHPADLLDAIEPDRTLVLCDASSGAGPPGTTRRWTWPVESWPVSRTRDSHGISLDSVLRVAEAAGRLPHEVTVWTIEGRIWSPAQTPSPAVASAAQSLTARLDEEYGDA
jgi:hydrogenase maturation protease